MSVPTTASLICPACGQAFLSMQQSMEGMVQCPHCAHNALRGYFGTQAQVAGVTLVRRRVSQTPPLQGTSAPASEAPPLQDAHAFSQPTSWPGAQPQPVQTPAASMARPVLQPSQALLPTGAPPPPQEPFVTPPHLRTSPWRNAFIMLAFTVVCGGALWLWRDSIHAPAVKPGHAAPLPAKVEVEKIQVAAPVKSTAPVVPLPDMAAALAEAKALATELFAAETPERRAACILDGEKYSAEIEELLGTAAAQKNELRLLAPISGLPLTLPGGKPVPLFKLATSRNTKGALVRLEPGADGRRRIFWPLFYETHEAKLSAFVKQADAAPAWFYVGVRPSHGMDLAADLRTKYLTFDVQISPVSDPHFVACIERDTPLGRFLDRETEWGTSYLARLLVRKLDIQAEAPCLLVIDCEGSPER
ncbi:hypothetical protein [Prosthecobacter sp.]|uniref:hypothetical protein n=1 Tax=Prosthecobacter sp. TaxID=1965333 RepID=UPI003784C880